MSSSKRASAFVPGIRRWAFKPSVIVALLGGIIAAVGVGAMAQNAGGGWHHGGGHAMTGNPADMAAHVDEVLQHIYAEVGATDAQKAQLEPIVQQAATDLAQVHGQLHSGHAQILALLTQDTIDRNALETARSTQMDAVDEASRRIVQLVADAADVLTPVQRKALADHLSRHMDSNPD